MNRSSLFDLFAGCLVALACYATYGATLSHEFVFDDRPRIEFNEAIQVDRIGTKEIRNILATSGNRPVAYLTLALNHSLGGLAVEGYHFANTLIHFLNGLWVYAIASILLTLESSRVARASGQESASSPIHRMLPVSLGALFTSLVFSVHPVQVQAVTYVIQRITSLCVLFCLASFLCFLMGRRAKGTLRFLFWTLAFGAWLLGLATKEIALCLPALVFLAEWFFFRDLDMKWLRRFIPWIAVALVLVFALGLVYLGGELSLPGYARRDFSPGERLLTQSRVVVFYLSLLLFPDPGRMSIHQVFETSQSLLTPPSTLGAFFVLGTLLLLAVVLAKRERLLSFVILWFFATLAIESSIIPLEMAFEHRIYFPLAGISLLFGWIVMRIQPQFPLATIAISTLAIALLGMATVERNRAWETRESLWADATHKNPTDSRAQRNLGMALVRAGKNAEAISHFEEAIRLEPDYYRAHFGLGQALAELGRHNEAILYFERALAIDPVNPEDWIARTNLGASLQWLGRLREAEQRYREVLEIHPENVTANLYLGSVLEAQGRAGEALSVYDSILATYPEQPNARDARKRLSDRGQRVPR